MASPVERLVGQRDLLHHRHRREDLADLVGQLGMAVDVLLARPFAPAVALEELLGEFEHRSRS